MNSLCRFIFVFTIFSMAHVVQSQEQRCNTLGEIDWIATNWTSSTEKSLTTESWNVLSDTTWEGSGAVYDNATGKLRNGESLRMVAMSGQVFYIAKVEHNAVPIAFTLSDCSATSAVFSNPTHDFPKQIGYQLLEPGRLRVRVSDGGDRGFEIHFQAAQ